MRIIIVGLGQTGQELAKELILAGHELIVVDQNKEVIEEFTNQYDAVGVIGNGACKTNLIKAKANNANLLISLTSNDEVNIMSAITAKVIGAKYTIARVSDEEYREDEEYLTCDLGIDMIINEEYDTAQEITRIITYPTSTKVGAFANGMVDVAEIKVKENSLLKEMKLTKLKENFNQDIIISSIIRNGKLIIPKGDTIIKEEDELNIIAKSSEIYKLLEKLNLIEKKVKSVFMVGCGKIGKYLLKNLVNMNLKVKVIEFDSERCIELAKEFPSVTIVHGNGVDSEVLVEEGINEYDCTVSLTGEDETNLVVTLFAWSCKVRKLITKVVSLTYTKMLHNVEIDNTLSPHLIILSSIHRFIRGIEDKNKNDGKIKSLYRFSENMAEAIEFEVNEEFIYLGKSIKDISIKRNILIAFIIRNKDVIIPNGNTTIEQGDRVIIIAPSEENIGTVSDIIE